MKNFYRKFSIFILFSLLGLGALSAQNVSVSGRIVDDMSKQPLTGVNVTVEGKVLGTVTDGSGKFKLSVPASETFALVFSLVGYETQRLEITESKSDLEISLKEEAILGSEVVISASRVAQNIMKSPVSIEKMNVRAIRETPAANFYDALANLKSVDMVATSLNFKTVNTRGFNSTANTRFVQIVDGMDNQAPGLNFSVGNIVGVSELDLESVELIPGAASALYGPNAFNGIMIMKSKSPFEYQGTGAILKIGANHVDGKNTDARPFYEMNLRYAKAFNNKFAFKANVSYTRGTDWYGADYRNLSKLNAGLGFGGATDPGRDGLHIYGDEATASNLAPLPGLAGVTISRTGYEEEYLVDYGTENFKAGGALHYRISSRLELIAQANYGSGTTVYTGSNRYSLSGFNISQYKLELKGDNFFLRGYTTQERSGDSYDSRFLALNINRAWKSDQKWFTDYATGYVQSFGNGNSIAQAHLDARAFADQGRLIPGTFEFESVKNTIRSQANFQTGAKFNDATNLYHAEGQYNFKNQIKFMDVLVGGNYRLYDLNSNGTIFPDTTGNNITIQEFGGYVQLSKALLEERLRITGAVRYDKNENFEGQFSPRISAVYTLAHDHNFRASFQTGFRLPTTQEQFIDLNVGVIRLLGGLPEFFTNYNLKNSFTLTSVSAFAANIAKLVGQGQNQAQAVINSAPLLQRMSADPVKPERIQSYEVGYKSVISGDLFVDIGYYYSIYKDFLGSQRVVRPNSNIDTDPIVAAFDVAQGNRQAFQVYTNSKNKVTSQGVALGITYNLPEGFTLGGNITWAKLKTVADDPIIPAFNTPEYKTNLTFGNREVFKNFGFNVAWRWSDAFRWQSPFADGMVPAYNVFDAQVSYKLSHIKSVLKLGAANILNHRYIQAFGAPEIGGLYYLSLTFDELMN